VARNYHVFDVAPRASSALEDASAARAKAWTQEHLAKAADISLRTVLEIPGDWPWNATPTRV
jgi:hypothetical protein